MNTLVSFLTSYSHGRPLLKLIALVEPDEYGKYFFQLLQGYGATRPRSQRPASPLTSMVAGYLNITN